MDFSKINLEIPKRFVDNRRKRGNDDKKDEPVVC